MTGFLALPDGLQVPVKDGLTIGRVGCDILLSDGKASRRHARVSVEGSVVEIEDLDSSNGTLLNGKRITRRMLRAGDEIQIGKSRLIYREAAPAAAPPFVEELDLDDPPPGAGSELPGASGLEGDPLQGQSGVGDVEILEFADDDVVEVRKRAPAPPPKPKPRAAATRPGRTSGGVLQFSQPVEKRGLLGDDMRQMSSGRRLLLALAVLVSAAGIGYLAMIVVSG